MATATTLTAPEMLATARKGRPNVRYAMTRNGNAIGAWQDDLGRFVQVAGLLLTGQWASTPHEVLVDGQPQYTADDWVE